MADVLDLFRLDGQHAVVAGGAGLLGPSFGEGYNRWIIIEAWTDGIVRTADVVVTMGCGDACPFFPGVRYEDWPLDDPAGMGVEAVRPIRDEIGKRVRTLLDELGVTYTFS